MWLHGNGSDMVSVYDCPVHVLNVLQLVETRVSRGSTRYFGGYVHAGKAERLVAKLDDKYGVAATRGMRAHGRANGRASTRLVMYPSSRKREHFWWLVTVTPGEHPALQGEVLRDARGRRERILFDGRYELVRLPRKGGEATWTWRLPRERFLELRAQVITAVRQPRGGRALEELAAELRAYPQTRGFRGQVTAIYGLIHAEWRRVHRERDAPDIPHQRQGYSRRQVVPRVPLAVVAARVASGEPPFTPEERAGKAHGG